MCKFVSVITVCYNASSVIEKTILSVLGQTYPNVEYIIIDGFSTDGTKEIIKKYEKRIAKIVSEPDKGIYDAMNKGINIASGEWVHFLNAGDIYHDNNVLEKFIPLIDNKTQIAYGDTMHVFSKMSKIRKNLPLSMMYKRMPFGHPATIVRLAYHKNHLFDTSFMLAGDYKFVYDSYYRHEAVFQYIPIVLADFEAENGASAKYSFLSIKEDAILHGSYKTLKWRLWFVHYCFRFYAEKMFKNIFPFLKPIMEKRDFQRIINNL